MTSCNAINKTSECKPYRDASFSRIVEALPGITLVTSDNFLLYSEAGNFVSEGFQRQYGAQIDTFMPFLMTTHNLGSISNVVGLRPAHNTGLYLEKYLVQPIETLLSEKLQTTIERTSIVEIGNQVSNKQGASQIVFLLMTATLLQAKFEWIVFTATHSLRNSLQKLNFPVVELAKANKELLECDEQLKWGSYFKTEPCIMAGRLDAISNIVDQKPLLRQTLRVYEYAIKDMSQTLRI